MSEQSVLYEVDGKVGIVALNRPTKLNALSMKASNALAALKKGLAL